MVGLFSSHANELRKAHGHLARNASQDRSKDVLLRSRRKAPPRFSEARSRAIVAGYMDGKTVYELADEHCCHRTTISAVLKRNGIELRLKPSSEEQIRQMIRLYESGLSLAAVGERVHCNPSTVLNHLRRNGIRTRDSHGRSK